MATSDIEPNTAKENMERHLAIYTFIPSQSFQEIVGVRLTTPEGDFETKAIGCCRSSLPPHRIQL